MVSLIRDRKGLSFLTRMRVTFSDLRDHRFNHNFFCQSPTCKCNRENETNEHFLLRCSLYNPYRAIFLRNIAIAVNEGILQLTHDHLSEILLFGSPSFDDSTNKTILINTIRFIKLTRRFKAIEAYSQNATATSPPNPQCEFLNIP